MSAAFTPARAMQPAFPGRAFDALADGYDEMFTFSAIGRAQRDEVWSMLEKIFHRGDRVLELNCGTGEDALFLGRQGISVVACDASAKMVTIARQRLLAETPEASIEFRQLDTECIAELGPSRSFDGVVSNFSGLNCVADLASTAVALSVLVRPGGALALCLSTRFCLVEILYFLLRGNPAKALRRCKGYSAARIGDMEIDVHYLTVRQLRALFAPHFRLISIRGIGVAVPPSYCEAWVREHPVFFRVLCRMERGLASIPLLRATGDHVLLHFRKEVL